MGILNEFRHDLQEDIFFLLKSACIKHTATLNRKVARFDISYSQIQVLHQLSNGRKYNCAELAKILRIDTGAATRLLDRMEEKELLERTRSADDGRIVYVKLTPKGRRLTKDISQVVAVANNECMNVYSDQEVDQLKSLLYRMVVGKQEC